MAGRRQASDPAAREAIIRALAAGNGRSAVVPDLPTLLSRLREDGHQFDDQVLHTALSSLIADGVVDRRRGYGIWLANGIHTVMVGDHPDVTDLREINGAKW